MQKLPGPVLALNNIEFNEEKFDWVVAGYGKWTDYVAWEGINIIRTQFNSDSMIKYIYIASHINPIYEVGVEEVKEIKKLENNEYKVLFKNGDYVKVFNPNVVYYETK